MAFRSQCKKQLHIIEVKCDVTKVYTFLAKCAQQDNQETMKIQKDKSANLGIESLISST